MATLTASSGTVNLTTPTGWSPAQIPQNGDDLIIEAATLNLDADLTLNTVTFNNASSRLDWSSLPRDVTAANGWFITGNLGSSALFIQSISSGILTLRGRWTVISGTNVNGRIATISGGTLNLFTINNLLSEILFQVSGNTLHSLPSMSSGALNTVGRILYQTTNTSYTVVGHTGGKWTHTSSGSNTFASGGPRFTFSGPASMDFTGRCEIIGGSFPFQFNTGHSGTIAFFGDLIANGQTQDRLFIMNSSSSRLIFTGAIETNAFVTNGGQGITIWQNTTVTIQPNQVLRFNQFVNLLSNITINNGGVLGFQGGVGLVGDPCSIVSTNINSQTYSGSITLNGRILPFQIAAPTLPSNQYVAAGIVYGFPGFEQTGTGLIVDPAILASAISANIPDIVDGVHEADLRDYDDQSHTLAWELKKLRQANPLIDFVVTDDIEPTASTFSVSITDEHNTGSFEGALLYFQEGVLIGDNNPILSIAVYEGYSVVVLQKPLPGIPEVGDVGVIAPLTHVYSIAETQNGLALEATSQSILEAINDIDVDFTPIETLIETSTQTILDAIAEEDDPTNVVNLQIVIKDQNDIGVAGVYVSIHGTAKSAVTNINGVAELWVNPNTNYNLRFVVPPGYTPLSEENIVVGISDIEEIYISPQIAIPSIPEELCELRIYIKSQGTTEVNSLENIRVTAKLIDDYKIVNQNLFINIIDVAESDENGYVALVLLKDTDYVLSLTRDNSIVIKRILIKTTNNAVQMLSEVINA